MESDDTSDPDFWKGTRKIIAASRSMYEKLGGVPAETDWSKHMAPQIEEQEDAEPSAERARVDKGKKRLCEKTLVLLGSWMR